MGTPHFSCPTLQKLLDDKHFNVVGVYTREPQIAGRGHKLTNSPIHEMALQNNLPVFTPKSLRNAQIQAEFKALQADAAVVVAYGLILPPEILNATKYGCINIHPSILPRWRGPSPIQYSLLHDDEIGVTIIKMDAGIDSGDMIAQSKFKLSHDDNYGNLVDKLSDMGAQMLLQSLYDLQNNKVVLVKQNQALATFSKKLLKEESKLDFNLSAHEILRKIRALSGSLTAYFEYNGENIKIFAAQIVDEEAVPGIIGVIDDKLVIQCAKGQIRPLKLQRPGKKIVTIEEFLAGLRA